MSQQPPPELPPHYYRDNFLRLCHTVQARYGDLLVEQERRFLETFHSLAFSSQCLYVRLVSRVGPWFRSSRLDYPEIEDLAVAIQSLQEAHLLLVADGLSVEDLGRLYTREEIREAMDTGVGSAERHSVTVREDMMYVAVSFASNGSPGGIVRTANVKLAMLLTA